jgi:(1->4)-alpha-D-glucan 1-alpha-D-glucosylmutase
VASLSQTLIRLTAPGVPDTYQGTEIWNLSLVDPDNRRPVDFDMRRRLIDRLDLMTVEEVMERMDEGLPKLWVITKALRLRTRLGPYSPLSVTGNSRDSAIAFSRGGIVTVAPRLATGRAGWGDTGIDLPKEKNWVNVLTGDDVPDGRVLLCDLFRRFPVALLTSETVN